MSTTRSVVESQNKYQSKAEVLSKGSFHLTRQAS